MECHVSFGPCPLIRWRVAWCGIKFRVAQTGVSKITSSPWRCSLSTTSIPLLHHSHHSLIILSALFFSSPSDADVSPLSRVSSDLMRDEMLVCCAPSIRADPQERVFQERERLEGGSDAPFSTLFFGSVREKTCCILRLYFIQFNLIWFKTVWNGVENSWLLIN